MGQRTRSTECRVRGTAVGGFVHRTLPPLLGSNGTILTQDGGKVGMLTEPTNFLVRIVSEGAMGTIEITFEAAPALPVRQNTRWGLATRAPRVASSRGASLGWNDGIRPWRPPRLYVIRRLAPMKRRPSRSATR